MNDNAYIDDPTHQQIIRARDAQLVERVRAGDSAAFGELYDTWFERVFNVALRVVHDTELATDVTQDAFLSAWRGISTLTDSASFGGWILRISRNTALNKLKKEARSYSVDDEGLSMIERRTAESTSDLGIHHRAAHLADPAMVAGDSQLVNLVREVADSLGERDAEVLDLTLRYQLTPAEVGQVLDINRNAANQLCHRVRERFATAFGARMLFEGGKPRCAVLRAELEEAEVSGFGKDAVRIAERHTTTCTGCADDRRTRLEPSTLFAAVPLVPVLALTRQQVAHALTAQGVPMHGSTAITPGTAPWSGTPRADSTIERPTGQRPEPPAPVGSPDEPAEPRRSWASHAITAAVCIIALVAWWVWATRDVSSPNLAAGSAASAGAAGMSAAAGAAIPETTIAPAVTAPPTEPASTAPVTAPTTSTTTTTPTTTPEPSPTTTSTTPPTAIMVPPAIVQRFVLLSGGQTPSPWTDAQAPRLAWTVTGAKEVFLRRYHDDGTGLILQAEIPVATSDSRLLCPGTRDAMGVCTSPLGRYTFELVIVRSDGSIVVHGDRVSMWVVQ